MGRKLAAGFISPFYIGLSFPTQTTLALRIMEGVTPLGSEARL